MKQQTVKSKTMRGLLLAAIAGLFNASPALAQCDGVLSAPAPPQSQSAPPAGCLSTFPGTAAKYATLSNYIPNTNDPVVTVKLVFHVFTPAAPVWNAFNNSNDPWHGLPALLTMLNGYSGNGFQNQTERFPDAMSWLPSNPNFNPTQIQDSKLRYEVAAVYFYTNSQLYYGTANGQPASSNNPRIYSAFDAANHVDQNFPGRLAEGMPIVMTTECQYQSGINSTAAGVIPFIAICHIPGVDAVSQQNNNNFAILQLRHEIGHALGLLHTYYGGAGYPNAPSCCPETPGTNSSLNCSSPEYLSDVFPPNNPNCPGIPGNPPTSACGSCYESTSAGYYSNNVMSSGPFNGWMSPLQMARRARIMHLNNTRIFAKDMLSGHTNPWLVTGGVTETWDFDIQMYKDILVKSGNTLIIKCKVAMATDGKIIVEKGAKLVIDGGEVTGWCKTTPPGALYNIPLWTGIEVDGDNTQNQLIFNPTGYAANHGIVEVKNGGKISKAYKGINTSLTNSANGNWIPNTSGGIVIGDGGIFQNNVFDIIFYKYLLGTVRSKLNNCVFETSDEIGLDGNGNQILPKEHVKLYQNSGLNIRGCNFIYSAPQNMYTILNRGIGLYTTDSHFKVDEYCTSPPCTGGGARTQFSDLTVGAWLDNFNPAFVGYITHSDFTNNDRNVIVENVHHFSFSENTISMASSGQGIYIYRSKYYDIKNNTISGVSQQAYGIIAYESKIGAHQIYRNTFSDLIVGIISVDENGGPGIGDLGLKMNCNIFNSATNNMYDIAVTHNPNVLGLVMSKQSQVNPASGLDFVRNLYDGGFKWYVQSGNQTIIHTSTPTGADNPNFPTTLASPQVLVINSNVPFSFSTHCPQFPSSSGGPGARETRLENINTSIAEYYAQNDALGFDVQQAVSSKMNLFLTDTLPEDHDSLVVLLETNQGGMDDADIQLIFIHMRKGDFNTALSLCENLPEAKEDWKILLEKMIEIEQTEEGIYSLLSNNENTAFLQDYASTDGKDGQASAQAMLRFVFGTDHDYPIVLPTEGERHSYATGLISSADESSAIKVYPNPAKSEITINYHMAEGKTALLEITDVLGKLVYSQDLSSGDQHHVPVNELSNGMYLLNIVESNKTIYKSKLIKQD
ncbi:MAG: T9SS type A sorting domain-containing protein [Bacteroidota bacterium]